MLSCYAFVWISFILCQRHLLSIVIISGAVVKKAQVRWGCSGTKQYKPFDKMLWETKKNIMNKNTIENINRRSFNVVPLQGQKNIDLPLFFLNMFVLIQIRSSKILLALLHIFSLTNNRMNWCWKNIGVGQLIFS